MQSEVIVIIGAGGIGQAIARRQGFGKAALLADNNDDAPKDAVTALGRLARQEHGVCG
jgi:NAD(P)-dependent dehydrogenase (short-subunit alcohol dehydrogenase family)